MPINRRSRHMKRLSIVLVILVLSVAGCSSLRPRVEGPASEGTSPEAAALSSRLQDRNPRLNSFKGTGRLRLQNADGIQRVRVMWAGYKDEKMRLEIMGPAGRPAVSFAYDGQRIYLVAHAESRYYSKRNAQASLEKLISLPIRVQDALNFLAGRIPADAYRSAVLLEEKFAGDRVLVMKRPGRDAGYDKIHVKTAADTIRKIESFHKNERLNYRVEFITMQDISGFQVPQELVFSDGDRVGMHLFVDQFWPNASVADSLFVLTEPK